MSEMGPALLPARFFRVFLAALTFELGPETLVTVLETSGLPVHLADPESVSGYDSQSAAQMYAGIQKAMRVYYGRGARGTLIRIGRRMWTRLLESASLSDRAQAQFIRTLPPEMRRHASLELLARFMREKANAVTVHSQDLDFLLVDHFSAAAGGGSETGPVCFVTLGLIQENLFWATGREHVVDEVTCSAAGGQTCEFNINSERKL